MTKNKMRNYFQRFAHVEDWGIQSPTKSFVRKKAFFGSWEEHLNSIVSVYETTATIYKLVTKISSKQSLYGFQAMR